MENRFKFVASSFLGFLIENTVVGIAATGAPQSGWKPLIERGLLEPLTLLLTFLTIGMVLWLVFYVEVHRQDPLREKLLGVIWRFLVTAILVGITLQFWFIIRPIPFNY